MGSWVHCLSYMPALQFNKDKKPGREVYLNNLFEIDSVRATSRDIQINHLDIASGYWILPEKYFKLADKFMIWHVVTSLTTKFRWLVELPYSFCVLSRLFNHIIKYNGQLDVTLATMLLSFRHFLIYVLRNHSSIYRSLMTERSI